MATGTVKWFNTQKGYGFIQPDQGGKDIFVHISAVERSQLGSLAEGQKIGFELQRDRKTGRESARRPPRRLKSASFYIQNLHAGARPRASRRFLRVAGPCGGPVGDSLRRLALKGFEGCEQKVGA